MKEKYGKPNNSLENLNGDVLVERDVRADQLNGPLELARVPHHLLELRADTEYFKAHSLFLTC